MRNFTSTYIVSLVIHTLYFPYMRHHRWHNCTQRTALYNIPLLLSLILRLLEQLDV